jgi:hypothetical protein
MRKTIPFLAAAAIGLALLVLAPTQAEATWFRRGYVANYYAPPVTYYYGPSYYAPPVYYPTYYGNPYVWSGQYRVTPYGTRYFYDRYYPGTNQYFYQYRAYPW